MTSYLYAKIYRRWSELIHRFHYHHMRVRYPADENGVTAIARCDWCGMSAKVPKSAAAMIAAMRKGLA